MICTIALNIETLKPANLERHLRVAHPNFSDRSWEYFEGKKENIKEMKLGISGSRFETSEKKLYASYENSLLIMKLKKSYTIDETLVKPCFLNATKDVLGKKKQKRCKITHYQISL